MAFPPPFGARLPGLLLPLLFLLSGATPAAAQLIRGQFVEEGSGAPVVGGFISLMDGNGARVGSGLSAESGRFFVEAPGPGEYVLRGERIGFSSVDQRVVVQPGEALDVVLRAPTLAIQLQGIVASADRRCRVRPEAGAAAAVLWEEARKALDVVALTGDEQALPVQLVSWERELDPRSLLIRDERRTVRQGFAVDPVRSLPAEELARDGYIRVADDGSMTYYGPDQAVLLSDVFQNSHCFRVEEGDEDGETAGLVGLAFEPMERDVPDVEGTLWLDGESAQLRFLEYRYSRYPHRLDDTRNLGGRVDFQRRGDGRWFVREWAIRMPQMSMDASGGRIRLDGILEAGGEVIDARPEGGWQIPSLRGVVEGVAMDRIRNQPLAGAQVYLSGTSHSTQAGPDGFFRMEGIRPGRYGASYTHPRADMMGYRPGLVEVRVAAGETGIVTLELPPEALTGDPCRDGLEGVLWGVVRDPETGDVVPGARVTVTWDTWRINDAWPAFAVGEIVEMAEVTADELGRYRLCEVPTQETLQVAAGAGPVPGPVMDLRLDRHELRELDLLVADSATQAAADAEGQVAGRLPPGARTPPGVDPFRDPGPQAAPARRSSISSRMVSREDIAQLRMESSHALDIVLRAIPALELRGGGCLTNRRGSDRVSGGCTSVMLVVDGLPQAQPENYLTGVRGGEISSIEYIPPNEAGARYGTGSTAGVILLRTGG
jgi:hypothetical protein